MRVHNFVEDSKEEFHRAIFCRKCGQVAWLYNFGKEPNLELQSKIKPCVESEDLLKEKIN